MENINAGDTAWLLASAALVMLMTPALGFFYGGLVRRKNVLATAGSSGRLESQPNVFGSRWAKRGRRALAIRSAAPGTRASSWSGRNIAGRKFS